MINRLRRLKHSAIRAFQTAQQNFATAILQYQAKNRVISGPFSGMKILPREVFGSYPSKLLGTYELELHESIQELPAEALDFVLNIGAAEGYYGIGLLLRHSGARGVFFEALAEGQELIAANAMENKTAERMTVRGFCSESDLYEVLGNARSGTLIMDVEGGELDLLSERVVERLSGYWLIIESHDFARPGCFAELLGRLKGSHLISEIVSQERQLHDFPARFRFLASSWRLQLMDEKRPGQMKWLAGRPRVATR